MRLAEDAVGETGMMSNLLFPPRVRREGLRVKKLANRVLEDLFRQRQMNTRMWLQTETVLSPHRVHPDCEIT